MAKTTVNLTDTVTNWVTKTNQISNTIGDLTNLNTTVDSDVVGAINELKSKTDLLDSADITLSDTFLNQLVVGKTSGSSGVTLLGPHPQLPLLALHQPLVP